MSIHMEEFPPLASLAKWRKSVHMPNGRIRPLRADALLSGRTMGYSPIRRRRVTNEVVTAVSGTWEPEAPLRADARRNREQIINAARRLFVERGADVPMDEIAREAGVGVGTLYRRFPDREELIRAVSVENFRQLRADAKRIVDEETDPGRALERLLRLSMDLRLGMTLSLLSPREFAALHASGEITDVRAELLASLATIVERAQEAGSLRADVGAGDVVFALTTLARPIAKQGHELAEMVSSRLVAIMLDGLRATPGSPLPGRAVTAGDLETLRLSGNLAGMRVREG
jgi:AcrR family transcriptional regulator